MYDPFDDAVQPKCPECGTVLHNAGGQGYVCRHCEIVVIGTIPSS